MAIAAELLSLTGPPSAADWSAVGVAAALETRVTAAAAAAAAVDSIITTAKAAAVNAADATVAFEGRVGLTMSPLARVLSLQVHTCVHNFFLSSGSNRICRLNLLTISNRLSFFESVVRVTEGVRAYP